MSRRRSAFDPEHGQKGGVADLEEEIQRYKRRGGSLAKVCPGAFEYPKIPNFGWKLGCGSAKSFAVAFPKLEDSPKTRPNYLHILLQIPLETESETISPLHRLRYAELLRTQIVDSVTFLHSEVSLGSKVLVEGANAALLDVDFGSLAAAVGSVAKMAFTSL